MKIIPTYHTSRIVTAYTREDQIDDPLALILQTIFTGKKTDYIQWDYKEIKDGIFGYMSSTKITHGSSDKEHFRVRSKCAKCNGSGKYNSRRSCFKCGANGVVSITLTTARSNITKSTPEAISKKAQKKADAKAEREAGWAKENQDRIDACPEILHLQRALKTSWFLEENRSFATELVQRYGRWGNISEKQMQWAIRLGKKPEPVSPIKSQDILDLENVIKHLEERDASFAQSLVNQSTTRPLSPKQMNWVKKLTKKGKSASVCFEEGIAKELRDKYLNF